VEPRGIFANIVGALDTTRQVVMKLSAILLTRALGVVFVVVGVVEAVVVAG